MLRPIRRTAPLAAAGLLVAALALPAGSGAASSTTCKLTTSQARHSGPTYIVDGGGRTIYHVRATSCATGLKVIKAFHKCRLTHGAAGRCTTKVQGYACRETRSDIIPTQFTGHVTCKRGSASVSHQYQQDT